MPSVFPLRSRPVTPYAQGFLDGQRAANERLFWFGVAMGCVLSTVIALAILHFTGATI